MIGWRQGRSFFHARLDATGASLDATPVEVPHAGVAQVTPAVGTVGGKPFLALCEASGMTERTIRHVLLEEDAEQTAGPIFEIPHAQDPTIASGPTSTLLAWSGTKGIMGAIVAEDGSIGPTIVIAAGVFEDSGYFKEVRSPRAVASGGSFVVTYTAQDDYHDWIEAVRVGANGDVAQPEDARRSGVAIPVAVGEGVLVASTSEALYGGRIRIGILGSSDGLELGPTAPGYLPSLASDGSQAIVVWTDDATRRVFGALVDAKATTVQGPFALSPSGVEAHGAAAAFDGENFLVVWRQLGTTQADLVGARVSRSGEILDAEGFAVSSEPDHEHVPVLARASDGVVMAYGRFEVGLERLRIRTRALHSTAE